MWPRHQEPGVPVMPGLLLPPVTPSLPPEGDVGSWGGGMVGLVAGAADGDDTGGVASAGGVLGDGEVAPGVGVTCSAGAFVD